MKILLSKGSIAKIALLILLSLNALAGMTILVDAATAIKDPTVFVDGSGSVELTWKSGKSENYSSNAYANLGGLDTVAIIPTHGWHIDSVLFDGNPEDIIDEDGFILIDVKVKREVSVTFQENGGVDDVDTGSNMPAYPDPGVALIFVNVTAEGYAYAYTIELQHRDQILESWDIQTNATFQDGVNVSLVFNLDDLLDLGIDPHNLALWKTEVVLGDVNLDGIVDGTDVSIIANVNPDDPADPTLDLNHDGIIDNEDVNIASHNVGEESVWEQLQSEVFVDLDKRLVYVSGVTDDLSIFGVH
jgi:hypothetical protein